MYAQLLQQNKLRILSVCPSNTDLCEHLGILSAVVGRDTWSDWPQMQVDQIPLVGSVLDINIDKVVDAKPDIILASQNVPGMENVVPKLLATGIPTQVFDPECWDDVVADIKRLGELLGIKEKANQKIEQANRRIERLKDDSKDMGPIGMYIEWWHEPFITAFESSYVNQVLSWINVKNVFASRKGRSGKVTKEEILAKNPALYSISWCGTPWRDYSVQKVYQTFEQENPEFIQKERVFALWEGIIGHPSLRLLDGAERILNFRRQIGI